MAKEGEGGKKERKKEKRGKDEEEKKKIKKNIPEREIHRRFELGPRG